MQTGLKIRELPMVVQKVNDVLKIDELNTVKNGSLVIPPPSLQDKELMEQINGVVSDSGLFKMLEQVPAENVTPVVAVHSLKRIIHLNNNHARRNLDLHVSLKNSKGDFFGHESDSFTTFSREAELWFQMLAMEAVFFDLLSLTCFWTLFIGLKILALY